MCSYNNKSALLRMVTSTGELSLSLFPIIIYCKIIAGITGRLQSNLFVSKESIICFLLPYMKTIP